MRECCDSLASVGNGFVDIECMTQAVMEFGRAPGDDFRWNADFQSETIIILETVRDHEGMKA